MASRAPSSGITLTEKDAAIVKGMLARGDRQHDIAAWFGVNGGRIGEIASGRKFRSVAVAPSTALPPPGPYLAARDVAVALSVLADIKKALVEAEARLK